MILKLRMKKEDPWGKRIFYEFKDYITSNVVATATDNVKEWTTVYYEGNKYEFNYRPKFIVKPQINIGYPLTSKRKKTIGIHIIEDEDCIAAKSYHEAARVRKKGFLKNITLTVFEYQQEPYMLYQVGFKNQSSHYYCLYSNYGETVAIIERHRIYSDNFKASIYLEHEEHILIALFACTKKIICVDNSGSLEDRIDPSAAPYISILEEEKAMLDRSFIERVKEMAKEDAKLLKNKRSSL